MCGRKDRDSICPWRWGCGLPGTVFRQTTGQDDVSGRAVAGWERAFGARSAVSGACGAGVRAEGAGCSESECERSSGGGGRGRVGAEVAAASRGPVNSPESFTPVKVDAQQMLSEAAL